MDNNTASSLRPRLANSTKRFIAGVFALLPAQLHAQQCWWEALSGGGFTAGVRAFTVFDGGGGPRLHVGGGFRQSTGNPVSFVGRWEGQGWSALGSSVGGPVLGLTVFDDGSGLALCVGGVFGGV
jgi:hypothetical protein